MYIRACAYMYAYVHKYIHLAWPCPAWPRPVEQTSAMAWPGPESFWLDPISENLAWPSGAMGDKTISHFTYK